MKNFKEGKKKINTLSFFLISSKTQNYNITLTFIIKLILIISKLQRKKQKNIKI